MAEPEDRFNLSIRSLIGFLFCRKRTTCLGRAARFHLLIDFWKFEPEKSSDTMSRQAHLIYPAIYRVIINAEMCSYILNPDPSFFSGHFINLFASFWSDAC